MSWHTPHPAIYRGRVNYLIAPLLSPVKLEPRNGHPRAPNDLSRCVDIGFPGAVIDVNAAVTLWDRLGYESNFVWTCEHFRARTAKKNLNDVETRERTSTFHTESPFSCNLLAPRCFQYRTTCSFICHMELSFDLDCNTRGNGLAPLGSVTP